MIWVVIILIIVALAGYGTVKMVSDHIKKVYIDWRVKASYWSTFWNVPASLTLAVIHKESAGFEKAKGKTGDYGLMQITQPALTDFNTTMKKSYTLEDMLEANKNIEVGTWYLSWLHTQYGLKWFDVLRAYNVGIGTVQKSDQAGLEYAAEVISYQKSFQELMI